MDLGRRVGGGVGYLVRKHGLTIDDLLAAEIVTADGQLLLADTHTHPDLFWAIRGGGSNFGIATRLKFRRREVGSVLGGMLILPATPEVIASFIAEVGGRAGGTLDHRQYYDCAAGEAMRPLLRFPLKRARDSTPYIK